MADNKSCEGGMMNVKYICLNCHHEYREITFDKKEYKEELVCPHCKGKAVDRWKIAKYIGGADFSSKEDYTVEATFDINGTIKGLKAIQREAKKATAALKELEEQKKDKYLVIELDELGNLPKVLYKGKEITAKEFINFQWTTKSEVPGNTDVIVDYFEKDSQGHLNSKSIREGRLS